MHTTQSALWQLPSGNVAKTSSWAFVQRTTSVPLNDSNFHLFGRRKTEGVVALIVIAESSFCHKKPGTCPLTEGTLPPQHFLRAQLDRFILRNLFECFNSKQVSAFSLLMFPNATSTLVYSLWKNKNPYRTSHSRSHVHYFLALLFTQTHFSHLQQHVLLLNTWCQRCPFFTPEFNEMHHYHHDRSHSSLQAKRFDIYFLLSWWLKH